MCGICGIYSAKRQKICFQTLQKMTSTLVHRGPDDEGYFTDEGIGLGFRRLSIIDLLSGNQPISNEDSTIHVVCNGEIYNYKELRKTLSEKGHKFKTQGDVETILHLYEDYGIDCVKHLNGMFAFALWDSRRKQLIIVRDRIGIKPLYYARHNDTFIFGSEIKAIIQSGLVSTELDLSALDDYMTYLYIPAPRTIYSKVKKLPPGHMLICLENKINLRKYWDVTFEQVDSATEDECREQLLSLLKDSVKQHMVSDVPIGGFLSGGVDSSTVVSLMSQISEIPVKTFSIGFPDKRYDETHYSRALAKRCFTDHTEEYANPEIKELLPKLVDFFDQPFADSSAIPTFLVSKLAREKVTVALSGDGGDELFGGYDWMRMTLLAEKYSQAPKAFRKGAHLILRLMRGISPNYFSRMLAFSEDSFLEPRLVFHRRISSFSPSQKKLLYRHEFADAIPLKQFDLSPPYSYSAIPKSLQNQLLYYDTKVYLPDDILTKVDMMSMFHALEVRVPLLDYRVVEFCAKLPFDMKIRKGKSKYLLKSAVKNLLPKQVLTHKKRGFSIPVHRWLRNEIKDFTKEIILSQTSPLNQYMEVKSIADLFNEHMSGIYDHGHRLWSLLVLGLWLDKQKRNI